LQNCESSRRSDECTNREVGGHFGFVVPLVTRAHGETTIVADDFVVGFPAGITLKKTETIRNIRAISRLA
jgi:hypothetical protein